jgi:hypothetical protein
MRFLESPTTNGERWYWAAVLDGFNYYLDNFIDESFIGPHVFEDPGRLAELDADDCFRIDLDCSLTPRSLESIIRWQRALKRRRR